MASGRKTRQQKVQKSQRQRRIHDVDQSAQPTSTNSSATSATMESRQKTVAESEAFGAETYHLVAAEIIKISKISLICFALLAIVTLFVSDLSGIEWLRNTLGLPALF